MEDYSLFELEKDFFLGNYQSCINKANSMPSSRETLYYMCLSYHNLKKYDILNLEASKSKDQCIHFIQMLVEYTTNVSERPSIINDLELEEKSVDPKDDLSRLVISSIYVHEKKYADALRVLHPLDSLTVMFARIGIYIAMNRYDLAEQVLKIMQSKDDYATVTLLAAAQVRLATGRAKEAHDIARELEDKYRATPLLKNIQTAAAISMGNIDMAKEHCENSLDMDNDNLEALLNMIFIISKSKTSVEIKERHLDRLKAAHPNHELVQDINKIGIELKSL